MSCVPQWSNVLYVYRKQIEAGRTKQRRNLFRQMKKDHPSSMWITPTMVSPVWGIPPLSLSMPINICTICRTLIRLIKITHTHLVRYTLQICPICIEESNRNRPHKRTHEFTTKDIVAHPCYLPSCHICDDCGKNTTHDAQNKDPWLADKWYTCTS